MRLIISEDQRRSILNYPREKNHDCDRVSVILRVIYQQQLMLRMYTYIVDLKKNPFPLHSKG